MAMKSFSVKISMIRQYAFCPRIPYYTEIAGIVGLQPDWVQQGTTYHAEEQRKTARRNLKKFGVIEGKTHLSVYVEHNGIGMYGQADMIIELDDEIMPVEFKTAKPRKGGLLQLAAYGMAAEVQFGKPYVRGFYTYGRRATAVEVPDSEKTRNEVKKIVTNIAKMRDTGLLPNTSASEHQCSQCEFLRLCNDRNFDFI